MKLPEKCHYCGKFSDVDYCNLSQKKISGIVFADGFCCDSCGAWNFLFFSSILLEDGMKKLSKINPSSSSFWYHFVKTRKRAEQLQEKGRQIWQDHNTKHG